METRTTVQSSGTTGAAALQAGRPTADARYRRLPGAVTGSARLSSHRIDWIDGGDNVRDRVADGLQRVWVALGAMTRPHRALATVVMASAMSLPIGLAGAVVLVRGDPGSLTPAVALAVAATGLWVGTCCLSYLEQCGRVLRGGEPDA